MTGNRRASGTAQHPPAVLRCPLGGEPEEAPSPAETDARARLKDKIAFAGTAGRPAGVDPIDTVPALVVAAQRCRLQ